MATSIYGIPNQDYTDVDAAIRAASAPAPSILSPTDRRNMFARVNAQNAVSTGNAISDSARSLGSGSAAQAMQGARLKAGAGASAAGTMAQIDVDANQKQTEVDMQQRAQQLESGNLALSRAGQVQSGQEFNTNLSWQREQFDKQTQNQMLQYVMGLLGGAGGSGGAGGGGGTGLAADMAQGPYMDLEAEGYITPGIHNYNKLVNERVQRQRADPYGYAAMQAYLNKMQMMLGATQNLM